jgi:uncharacterized membrane protein HdeD (DUF308 family)
MEEKKYNLKLYNSGIYLFVIGIVLIVAGMIIMRYISWDYLGFILGFFVFIGSGILLLLIATCFIAHSAFRIRKSTKFWINGSDDWMIRIWDFN